MKFLLNGIIYHYERFSHEILKLIHLNPYQVRHVHLEFTQNKVSCTLITFRCTYDSKTNCNTNYIVQSTFNIENELFHCSLSVICIKSNRKLIFEQNRPICIGPLDHIMYVMVWSLAWNIQCYAHDSFIN